MVSRLSVKEYREREITEACRLSVKECREREKIEVCRLSVKEYRIMKKRKLIAGRLPVKE
jgi:hypothetical protein